MIFFNTKKINFKVGQVDFYPNGGQAHQPGCEDEDAFGLECSHFRAPVSWTIVCLIIKRALFKKVAPKIDFFEGRFGFLKSQGYIYTEMDALTKK